MCAARRGEGGKGQKQIGLAGAPPRCFSSLPRRLRLFYAFLEGREGHPPSPRLVDPRKRRKARTDTRSSRKLEHKGTRATKRATSTKLK